MGGQEGPDATQRADSAFRNPHSAMVRWAFFSSPPRDSV
jgi:hypothetical protein